MNVADGAAQLHGGGVGVAALAQGVPVLAQDTAVARVIQPHGRVSGLLPAPAIALLPTSRLCWAMQLATSGPGQLRLWKVREGGLSAFPLISGLEPTDDYTCHLWSEDRLVGGTASSKVVVVKEFEVVQTFEGVLGDNQSSFSFRPFSRGVQRASPPPSCRHNVPVPDL